MSAAALARPKAGPHKIDRSRRGMPDSAHHRHAKTFCQRADHHPVPGRQNLLVAPGLDSPFTRVEEQLRAVSIAAPISSWGC